MKIIDCVASLKRPEGDELWPVGGGRFEIGHGRFSRRRRAALRIDAPNAIDIDIERNGAVHAACGSSPDHVRRRGHSRVKEPGVGQTVGFLRLFIRRKWERSLARFRRRKEGKRCVRGR